MSRILPLLSASIIIPSISYYNSYPILLQGITIRVVCFLSYSPITCHLSRVYSKASRHSSLGV